MSDLNEAILATGKGPPEPRRHAGRHRMLQKFLQARLVVISSFLITVILALAMAAPWLSPFPPEEVDIRNRLTPPAWLKDGTSAHLLGTDHVGRDILSRILFGARISLLVGVSTVFIGGVVGIGLGVIAGYLGGRVEALIMRTVDIQLAFPSVLLAVALMAVLGSSIQNVILVLSLSTWASFCRIARAQTLSIRRKEFVTGIEALGAHTPLIIARYIFPNIASPLIIVASFSLANNIINEASLSFLGVGIPPSIPTWGGMLGEGRNYLRIAWWVATLPGIALMLTVYSVNVIGDWLRDYLDPRLRE